VSVSGAESALDGTMKSTPTSVLIIDDEAEIQSILSDYLTSRGFLPAVAGSAEAGMEELLARRHAALILDLNLPGRDGLTLLEEVRQRGIDIAVVIITGYATADSAIEALRRGIDDYLQKPFDLDDLGRALERALEGRRLRRENRALVMRLQRMNGMLDRRRKELAERVTEATRNLRLLLDSARDLNKDLDLEETLDGVVRQAAGLVRARRALVFLPETGSDRFALAAATRDLSRAAEDGDQSPAPKAATGELSFARGEGLVGRAVLFGRPLSLGTNGNLDHGDPLRVLAPQTALAVPMLREGSASGALLLLDRLPDPNGGGAPAGENGGGPATEFSGEDEEMALTLAAHAALAIRNAQIYEEARRLDRLQSEFVAAVSHELRTPLTQMKAALEIFDTHYGAGFDPNGRALIANTETAVRTLEDQIELILASAEIETDALALDLAVVPAREVADDAARRLLPVGARRGIQIDVVQPPPEMLVRVDRRRFVRALSNLLSNAVKFSDSGQTVKLDVEAAGELVRFHVIDRGIGIDPADQPYIFRRFSQLDGSLTRPRGGTGLGLSVSLALVERHGGTILVRSRPGEGSRFTIEIPAAAADLQTGKLADVA
jgi:signal transduction histidine kinase/FixJ family two-component response regulator